METSEKWVILIPCSCWKLIVLGLALLPSNPFHRGPDGVWSLEKTTQPIQAAASSAASGRLPTLKLLPELMGKLAFCVFFHSRLFLRGDKVRPQEEPPRSKECELCVYGKGCKPSSLTLRAN